MKLIKTLALIAATAATITILHQTPIIAQSSPINYTVASESTIIDEPGEPLSEEDMYPEPAPADEHTVDEGTDEDSTNYDDSYNQPSDYDEGNTDE
jgi:hypothetical protein